MPCCGWDVSQCLHHIHTHVPVPLQSGCFLSPSAVLCHPAALSRCSLGPWLSGGHHPLLLSGQASSWQFLPAQPGRELHHSVFVGQSPAHSCVGHLEHCSPGSSVVCGESWLLVEQGHVLHMPPSAVVQAAFQGWEPRRSLSCSGFPLSPNCLAWEIALPSEMLQQEDGAGRSACWSLFVPQLC